ncbi:hypothetical protein G647_08093 [Cladophialophora carrionii CBS 160.54]|uniref:Uncharacterized protein n=1 Tax=Cladophialophora carrionii CBS 160.54 TaxID=1279043 RepID=V9D505_9EURO|nr:uncharacterized protein G647_08093 [Cladophialophora carrionii CBS 160.54]ETI21746.1 hypothetical protein G647_08093 [Cladophialophora carrionii CBS 160.54]
MGIDLSSRPCYRCPQPQPIWLSPWDAYEQSESSCPEIRCIYVASATLSSV